MKVPELNLLGGILGDIAGRFNSGTVIRLP
jgi:hypothetical protein